LRKLWRLGYECLVFVTPVDDYFVLDHWLKPSFAFRIASRTCLTWHGVTRALRHRRHRVPLAALRFRHPAMRHLPVVGIDALAYRAMPLTGRFQPMIRQLQQV